MLTERQRATKEHQTFLERTSGVEVLSSLDLDGFPPFDYAHEHFGYRDRLSEPQIEGTGVEPTPGSGAPVKAGEFILGHVDESGELIPLPQAGSPLPKWHLHGLSQIARACWRLPRLFATAWRTNNRGPGTDRREVDGTLAEWSSARSGTREGRSSTWQPITSATTISTTRKWTPKGMRVPLGAHIRRMNPRDTTVNIQRRRMIRRGATYGPPLPEGAPEDGVDRGIAAFVLCASLVRQFEFAQNVWINDPNFHELGNERDPLIGNQDGTFDMTIPKRPIRKKITGLPAFTTLLGGAYFFLPSIRALNFLTRLN